MIAFILKFFTGLINRTLQLDPEISSYLATLNGKSMAVEVIGLPLKFTIACKADEIVLDPNCNALADASLKGTPLGLLRLLISAHATTVLAQSEIDIQGDVEVLQHLKQVLQNLDIDWEEYLSRFIGDIPAHQLGNSARSLNQWRRQTASNIRQNLTEYLQEELQYFPPREQVMDFMEDVDKLRDDAERLQMRFERLSLLSKLKDPA